MPEKLITYFGETGVTQLDALITVIINDLTPEERFSIANLDENEIRTLELVMGRYMKFKLAELSGRGNDDLFKECREKFGDQSMDDADAPSSILKEVWKQIKEAHRLRFVK